MINFKYKGTTYNFGLPFRSGQALTTGFATLVLVTSIAKQSRANGNVSLQDTHLRPTSAILLRYAPYGTFLREL